MYSKTFPVTIVNPSVCVEKNAKVVYLQINLCFKCLMSLCEYGRECKIFRGV